jgi:hypothetical protein
MEDANDSWGNLGQTETAPADFNGLNKTLFDSGNAYDNSATTYADFNGLEGYSGNASSGYDHSSSSNEIETANDAWNGSGLVRRIVCERRPQPRNHVRGERRLPKRHDRRHARLLAGSGAAARRLSPFPITTCTKSARVHQAASTAVGYSRRVVVKARDRGRVGCASCQAARSLGSLARL